MKIKLDASSIPEALRQLGYIRPDITIRFRKRKEDYQRQYDTGAVVEFLLYGEVPKEFDTADEAIEYLRVLLTQHDLLALNQDK